MTRFPAHARPARPTPRPWGVGVVRLLLAGVLGLLWVLPAAADRHGRLAALNGVAVGGYDPVAYFHEGAARPGNPEIALRWRGVRWHFATPAHRAAFEANPKAYAPAFGGHCAVSVADGLPRRGDPLHWLILDGRLVLTAEPSGLARLRATPDAVLQSARRHWSAPQTLAGVD